MKSYRIFIPLFLCLCIANQAIAEPTSQSNLTRKNETKKVKKSWGKKSHNMSMYTKEIHPADKMLVNHFGKKLGFDPQDFSKIDEDKVCSKKACKKDLDQSTCYRGFKGDIENPEKGCQGYQRRSMGKRIGKERTESRISSSRLEDGKLSKPGRKPAGKPTIDALDDGPLNLEVLENSAAGITQASAGQTPAVPGESPAAAVAGFGAAAVVGGIVMHNIADDDDTVTPGSNRMHAMFDPAAAGGASPASAAAAPAGGAISAASSAGFTAAGPGAVPAATACSTQVDAEVLGDQIKNIHNVEFARLGIAPVAGSENPQASHQALYNLVVSHLSYLSTITDKRQLDSGLDLLTGRLIMLTGNNNIQSHFSKNLVQKIISALSCIKNIGTPLDINENLGWLANAMAD